LQRTGLRPAAERDNVGRTKVKRVRWLAASLVVTVAISAAAWAVWNSHQRKVREDRFRQLTSCHPPSCGSRFECPQLCARQFLERNGYGDPALGRPDEMIFDIVESMHGRSREKVLAGRAHSLQMDPVWACERKSGYQFLFVDGSAADNAGSVMGSLLTMDEAFSNIHLHHQPAIIKRGPDRDDCRWLR
jgi:hypothetical protein